MLLRRYIYIYMYIHSLDDWVKPIGVHGVKNLSAKLLIGCGHEPHEHGFVDSEG